MANINTNNLAKELSKEAMDAWDAIADKLPNVRDLDRTPERLLNMQGENADIIGALYKNSIGEAEFVCRNGRAIVQCAEQINRLEHGVGLALLIGSAALCLGGYIYTKMNAQQNRIDKLEHDVAMLKLK